jgi:integrating conjugative element protein (TIGR03749 family)
MRYMLSVMLFFCLSMPVYADSLNSLTLTDAEMQKLKKYFPEEHTSHLAWKGDPISIIIPLNKEKRIIFPGSVSVDVKSALTADQLHILNNDQSIYLTALKSFSTTRIYVTLKETGQVVLIDLMTNEEASNATQHIDINQNNSHAPNKAVISTISETVSEVAENSTSNDDMNFADLIRSAWQAVYAPPRLIQNLSDFTRAAMHTERFVSGLVYGDKVIAYPESAWTSGNHYVTAILLRNKYSHRTHIDVRQDLCGDWQAASLYPTGHLKSYGDKRRDSAMLFLVSKRPFGDAMGVCHGDA